MSRESKFRPSLTATNMRHVSDCLYQVILQNISGDPAGMRKAADLISLKKYFDSFIESDREAELFAEYKQQAAGIKNQLLTKHAELDPAVTNNPTQEITSNQFASPLDNPDLTDEQKYDLIKLRPVNTYTDNEQAFILNTGTMILMRRNSNRGITGDDL